MRYLEAGEAVIGAACAPSPFSHCVELLRARAQGLPNKTAYVFLGNGDSESGRLSFAALDRRARAIAARLQAMDLTGERALLLYPPGLAYIEAFFGCLYAGVVAVPAYPPARRQRQRLAAIVDDAAPAIVLTTESLAATLPDDFAVRRCFATDGPERAEAAAWTPPLLSPASLAFLQYTSGSTGDPKGVMVSHGNLLANQAAIRQSFGHDEHATVVGWLPLYHDMGLIGNLMQPLYLGSTAVLMPPMAFLEKPVRWLRAIGKYRATTSGGPNFAYDLCVRKVTAEQKRELDLSSWTLAFNGSEPVRAATLERFAAAFAECGFRRESFFPCYGLAEATLLVTGSHRSHAPRGNAARDALRPASPDGVFTPSVTFDPRQLGEIHNSADEGAQTPGTGVKPRPAALPDGVFTPSITFDPRQPGEIHNSADEGAQTLGTGFKPRPAQVSCGTPSAHHGVLIVDAATRQPCAPGREGEIWVSGPSVAQGYWNRPELSAATFRARLDLPQAGDATYLRTGDLGLLDSGGLYVTGRSKDLIILRGRNHYPHDVEQALTENVPALQADGCVAFAVPGEDEEKLVVVAELTRAALRAADHAACFAAMRQILAETLELTAGDLVLVQPGVVPKTSSGKLRRSACKQAYLDGTLAVTARSGTTDDAEQKGDETGANETLRNGLQTRSGIAIAHPGQTELATPPETQLLRDALAVLPAQQCTPLIARFLLHTAARLLKLDAAGLSQASTLRALGLDSLKILELKHAVDELLGLEAPLAWFLNDDTLETLAENLGARASRPHGGQKAAAKRNHQGFWNGRAPGVRPSWPRSQPSATQRAMWTVQHLEPDSLVYNLHLALRVEGALDAKRLRQAFALLLQRHAALRTLYDAEAVPRVVAPDALPDGFSSVDACDWTEAMLQDDMARRVRQPFELAQGPLLCATLYDHDAAGHTLLLCAHHIALDLWSVLILIDELQTAYAALGEGQPPAWPALQADYADFIEWQQRYLAAPEAATAWDYWREQLAGELPVLALPTDHERPKAPDYRGASVASRLDSATTEALQALARRHGVSLFTLLLAAYKVLLHRYCGQDDVIVGVPAAGRCQARFAGVVGNFVNPLPLRTYPAAGKPFSAYLAEVDAAVRGALQHQDFPFATLVERLQPERHAEHWPIYQTLFVLQQAQAGYSEELAQLALGEDDPGSAGILPAAWGRGHSSSLSDSASRRLSGRRADGTPALPGRSLAIQQRIENFDLKLMAAPCRDGLLISFQYRSDLFEQHTIARWAGHFQQLLAGIVADGSACLGDLPLLTAAEKQRLLDDWNATAQDYPASATLHRLFEQQAERTPDAVALVYAAQQLSYRELNRQAEQLARQLVQLGVAGDAPVGICAERSIELVVAMLGVLKAGGAYLPLDPDYPQERLAAMMADADVRLILVQPRFIDSFDSFPSSAWERSPGSSGFPLSVVQLPKKLADAPAHHALQASASRTHTGSRSFPGRVPNLEVGNQPDQPDPQELAYVLFTSGSTGRPKGVGIPHGGVCNRLLWMQQRYALDDSDVVLQKTPYTFDVSVWEFFWPLLTGARLALLAPGAHREPERLAAAIKQYGVTTLHFVPSMLNAFLEAGAMAGCRTLRRVICSGEALSADLQARFFAHSDAELHNLYGPTEASIDVTAWACRRDLPATPVPIGHPIANTRIYLLDARLNPVPVGVPGELYIGGVQLARGYLNRPELTAERFVPNPFLRLEAGGRRLEAGDGKPGAGIETGGLTGDLRLKEAESNAGCQPQASDLPPYASRLRPPVSSLPPQTSRLYRSGDLARYRADGSIEYLGRLDHQVKIRGFRIELGEIEARLRLHPAVRQATVIAREDHPGDKRLVAYVVATGRTGFPPRPQRLDAPSAASESTSATEPTNVRDGVQTPSRPAGDPAPSAETLRAWLAAALPDYMIPAAFVTLENLPVTPNGKLDRKALPVPDIGGQFEHRYVAPGNALEARLSMLWAEVLRLERVGIHDNFFALGGDSILSIQVASRAHQAGHQLTPRAIFQHQTIAELAAFMAGDPAACRAAPSEPVSVAPFVLANLPAAELAALVAAGVEDAYPLSSMQEGMLFHTLASPASGIYVMQDRYEIRGPVDVAAFRQAWQAVLERHPVLRTAFVWDVAARPHQIVYRRLAPPCEYLDWSDADAAEQERRLASLLRTEQVRGFDLARAPLFHIRLIKRGDGRFLCVRSYHHILMDEWCTSPMLLEFRENYAALSQGRGCPERPLQPFRAYIAWIESRDAAKTESFWRRYLQGFTEPTALVGERTRNDYGSLSLRERAGVRELNSPDPSVADLSLELSAEDTAALHALSLRHRLTVNTFVQGALAFLLSRYSAQTDVVFGVTVSGRPSSLPGVETMLGLFINALPLRVQVQAQQPLLEWLQTLLARNLDLRQYEYASLVQIQSWSAIPRSEAELFQHLLTFENAPIDPSLLTEKDVLDMAFVHNRVHTNYPITFVAIPGERLHLRITYQLARFEAAVVQRMLEHFKRVLECMIRSPDRRVGQLSLLGEQECRVMQDWNRTGHAYNAAADFVARFAAQVERTPDAAAVACQGESLSYRALNARANRLAHGLIAQGVGPDGIVALLSDRGIGFAVAMLGVFKAGGAYLPLDPAQPDGRLAQVLLESRVGWVLAGANHLQRAQTLAGSPTVLSLESLAADTPRTDEPPRRHRADNLAFVIFTSGSTGTPKGAMVEHRGMFNNLITKVPTLALTEADVIAQTAGQCFDISVWQYLTALVCGARVEVFPDEIVKEPGRLLAGLAERGVTILEAVPSMIQALLEMVAECVPTQSVGTIRLPQLRWLLACGEAFAPELCRRWMARFPRVQVLNAYGPAECSDDVSYYRVPAIPGEADALVPIGYPVHNTRLYLLDPWLAPVPVGIPGEICVAGIQVGRGYLYRPDLTAARFLPDPHGAAGTRLYRTGDLGRYREDGCIEFLGRIDHQVKIRGFRIELGEIEAQLLALSPVEQAIVVVREDARCGKQLVAYLVCGPAATAPASDLIDALRRQLSVRLPDYMVPAAFVLLDAMPLGATGKIDRKALPAPDIAAQRQERYVAPRNPTETLLAGIWQEVLGVERAGVEDNFFDLGGHSLLAVQVLSRIQRAFGVEVSLRSVFEASTIAQLALVVEACLIAQLEMLSEEEAEALLNSP